MTSLPLDHEPLVAGKRPADTRVVVAMSGGVDSSVVAALLKDRGYDVVGVTLQLFDHGEATHRKGACCAGQDIEDARKVSERLGVPHFVLDYEARFREKVIDGFAESYANGETPVPCVACNQFVKFADLFDTARDLGADILATGHYISSRDDGAAGRALFRARDASRDQSYFLFATTREQLRMLRFPLGDYAKSEVRELARRYGLEVTPMSSSASRPGRSFPATSCTSTATCSGVTPASFTTPWAKGAVSGSARPRRGTPANRCSSCGSTPPRRKSSSARARRWRPAPWRYAT
jgi:tRNA-specific 2-thiouridylase